ncbi:hypothetical protein [Chitinophaga rhizophila]|uniref:Uncharacterized protein n=1 Tax=Chitinophaga rhizophila TaxID=2866212 RepID=A0ABS7G4X2_9BACT|nr:hypothetical protein [Chitinophaga rhizophila]MBW8682707.1 hypothetical protein [Chitinophaga rhizophila]
MNNFRIFLIAALLLAVSDGFSQTPTLQAVTDQGNSTTNPVEIRNRDGLAFNVDPRSGNVRVHFLKPSVANMATMRFECTSNDITAGWEFYNSNQQKSLMYIRQISGFVGIGTTGTPSTMLRPQLAVNGDIRSDNTKVTLNNWADHVFDVSYQLRPLREVAAYIAQYKHLPDIPSRDEICAEGQNLGDMQVKLLQKIEELTIHLIDQEKEMAAQEKLIAQNRKLLAQRENRLVMLEAYMMPPTDTVPLTIDQDVMERPAIKTALVNAINRQVVNTMPGDSMVNTLPFDRLGLGGLHTSARSQFTGYMRAGKTNVGISGMQRVFDNMKDSTRKLQYINNKLRGFYALRDRQSPGSFTLPGKPENKLKGASWTSTYSDSTGAMSGWWNEGLISDVFSIGSIPFQLNYSTLSGYDYAHAALQPAQFAKISFDREAYLDKINQQLQKKYDLQKYFLEDLDIKAGMKQYVAQQLATMKGKDSLSNTLSVEQLMYLDSVQLNNVLQRNGDTASGYYQRVMSLKKQLGGVKEMNKVLGSQREVTQNVTDWMKDPGNTANMADRLMQLGPLQRLMMHMKALRVGSIGADASKGSVSDLFMTGAMGSFLKGNKFIMLGMGKSKEMGIQDVGLQSATGNAAYSMQFLRIGRGDIGKRQSHVSVLNANAKPNQQYGFSTSAISRNIFVGAVSKQLSLGDLGTLDLELSKSSGQFGTNAQDAASVSKSAAGQFMNDIWATAAIGMAYNGDVKKLGLSHKVYVNYAGLGYVNPGAPFASRGTFQYGLHVKRNWLKNRAMVSVRTDIRNLAVSPLSDDKRRSMQYAFDGRYRFTRRFSLSMNLLQHSLNEMSDGKQQTAFLNRKLSFMSQANGKIAGKSFSNSSSIGLQQLNYLQPEMPIKSLFVNVSSMQTWMAGPGMFMVSVLYSRDLNNAAVYNNLLNTEGGYQYMLWKLSCSSTLVYMDSKEIVTQVGLRQQVAAQLLKRWSVSMSADGRHNIRNTAANYYYGRFNTAMSLHYQIN